MQLCNQTDPTLRPDRCWILLAHAADTVATFCNLRAAIGKSFAKETSKVIKKAEG